MKTYVHLYVAQLFVVWEMFQTTVVQKIKTNIACPIFFSESRAFLR
jgi:hypothetical protein